MRSCPKCGHPLAQPPCPMCAWRAEPPPAETQLLVGEQVVTIRWQMVAGVPVGDPVDTRSFWEWLQRHQS